MLILRPACAQTHSDEVEALRQRYMAEANALKGALEGRQRDEVHDMQKRYLSEVEELRQELKATVAEREKGHMEVVQELKIKIEQQHIEIDKFSLEQQRMIKTDELRQQVCRTTY